MTKVTNAQRQRTLAVLVDTIGIKAVAMNCKLCGIKTEDFKLPEWGFSVKINQEDMTLTVNQFKVP